MSTKITIPETLPVEFVERAVFAMGEAGVMRPQLGGVLVFDGRLDKVRLGRAVRLLLEAEPVLGCRFVADTVPPVWRRLDTLDAVPLLVALESDDPAARASSFIAELFDQQVDPQVLSALIRGPSSDVLALKVEHAAVDGGALKEALYLLSAIYRKLGEAPDWEPEPNLEGLRHPAADAGIFEKLRSLTPGSGLTPGRSDWNAPSVDRRGPAAYVSASIGPEVFQSAAALGKSVGATVNDIILTAFYRTLHRVLGAAPGSRTPISISCELRKHLPAGTKTALGNISSVLQVSVTPVANERFDGTLARVLEATREWKGAGAGRSISVSIPMVDRFLRNRGLGFFRRMVAKATEAAGDQQGGYPTLTNIGIIDEKALDFGTDVRVDDAWLLGPVAPRSIILTASTFRQRLHIAVGAEFAAIDQALVTGIVTGTVSEITSWTEGAHARRLTPAST